MLTGRGIRRQARAAARGGDWGRAAVFYAQLAARSGPLSDRIQLAHARKETGDEAGAFAAYRAAVAAAPLSAEAHRELSLFLLRIGDTDAALDALIRGWVAEPDLVEVDVELARLGVDRAALDRHVQVALAFSEAPLPTRVGRITAMRRWRHVRRARRAARGADWPAAERHYCEALVLVPRDVDARIQLGHALAEQRRDEAALAAYRVALLLRPGEAGVHRQIAHVLKRLGRSAAAFGALLTAWRLSPNDGDAVEFTIFDPGITRERLRADAAGFSLAAGVERDARLPMPANLAPRYALHYLALAGALGL